MAIFGSIFRFGLRKSKNRLVHVGSGGWGQVVCTPAARIVRGDEVRLNEGQPQSRGWCNCTHESEDGATCALLPPYSSSRSFRSNGTVSWTSRNIWTVIG